jgi:hypothetical protein
LGGRAVGGLGARAGGAAAGLVAARGQEIAWCGEEEDKEKKIRKKNADRWIYYGIFYFTVSI